MLLTVVAAPNSVFHGWGGVPGDTNANPLTLAMTTNRTVTVNFVLAPVPLIFTNLAINPVGHFSFTLLGPPAASLVLEAADALGAWGSIRTNIPFTGVYNFENLGTGSHTNRFYRAHLTSP